MRRPQRQPAAHAHKRRAGVALLAATLLATAASARAQVPSVWREQQIEAMDQSDAVMQRAQGRTDLLAQYQVMRRAYAADGKPAFHAIFGQYLSWYQTFLGDYADAERSFSIEQKALADDAPSPLGQPGWHAVPALSYIPQLAKSHRVVFLNEAHNIALTRTLTVRLLKPLREAGFNVFAVETLYQSDIAALAKRGYPTAASGFYTREPIYAEMVRTALKLGYKVVAYEADANHTGDAREAQQAQTLWKILKDDPKARLVVNAGYAHIQKTGQFLGAKSMAEHFIEDSGLHPLAVEQTVLIPHLNPSMNHPDYRAFVDALHPVEPVVLVNRTGAAWSLRPGYDVSVIFPEEVFVADRPTWAGLWGARVPYQIDGNVCARRWPCLVSARYADEGKDAIPADRMVLDPVSLMTFGDIKVTDSTSAMPSGNLYLRPDQAYRLTISDGDGKLIGESTITVKPPAVGLGAAPGNTTPGCASAANCETPPPQP